MHPAGSSDSTEVALTSPDSSTDGLSVTGVIRGSVEQYAAICIWFWLNIVLLKVKQSLQYLRRRAVIGRIDAERLLGGALREPAEPSDCGSRARVDAIAPAPN